MSKKNKSNYIQIIKITDSPSRKEKDNGKTHSQEQNEN